MILCYVKYKWRNHLLLGKKIGEGSEHLVFAKNDYVYKIKTHKTKNIFDFIEYIFEYYRKRNTIFFQLPLKFVGVAYFEKHFYPIFKQRRVEPVTMSDHELWLKWEELRSIEKDKSIQDFRRSNFGMLNGELKAIDVYLQ